MQHSANSSSPVLSALLLSLLPLLLPPFSSSILNAWCFYASGGPFVGVLIIIIALPFGAFSRAPDSWKVRHVQQRIRKRCAMLQDGSNFCEATIGASFSTDILVPYGVSKNQGHRIWTQNNRIPHVRTPKEEPPSLETAVLMIHITEGEVTSAACVFTEGSDRLQGGQDHGSVAAQQRERDVARSLGAVLEPSLLERCFL